MADFAARPKKLRANRWYKPDIAGGTRAFRAMRRHPECHKPGAWAILKYYI